MKTIAALLGLLAALPAYAQFQIPGTGVREGVAQTRPDSPFRSELEWSWAYGSDSELTYRRNQDLDDSRRDEFTLFAPTLFGFLDWRPNAWFSSRLETTLEVPIVLRQDQVVLPSGEVIPKDKFRPSILIDQFYGTFRHGPALEFTIGRRNFEDTRLWLYDAALDGVIVKHKLGFFQTEVSLTRESLVDADLLNNVPPGRVNYFIWHTEYRGFEDHKPAFFAIRANDRSFMGEGTYWVAGLRAVGRPRDEFSYWADFAWNHGRDELNRELRGNAFDVGATYRWAALPLSPALTLGYARGSGDGNRGDGVNREFRQTGLQSNETRFAGLTQFKRYGETVDPELSNIRIFSIGIGARLAPQVFLDVVHHRYRTNTITDQIRNWALTAQMNQDPTRQSRDVGHETDIILGLRNLFGVRRLGFEVRAGLFQPGRAFRNASGDPLNPTYRPADKSLSALAVIIY